MLHGQRTVSINYIDGQALPKGISDYLGTRIQPATYASIYDGKVLLVEEIEKEEASSNVQSTAGDTTADEYPSASSEFILTDGAEAVKEKRRIPPPETGARFRRRTNG